jgi:cytochrome oxidase Cu insertion factor (SCO1/SenC/PrrC family)
VNCHLTTAPPTTRITFGFGLSSFEISHRGLSMLARRRFATLTIAAGTSLALAARFSGAQQTAPAAAAVAAGPLVNDVAPDFTLQGADRYGLIKTPVKLSDFRGRTVVLAFFYQARTKG